MIEKTFLDVRTHLALRAVDAIQNGNHNVLHAIGVLLPILSQTHDSVFATLGELGDVEPPPLIPEQSQNQASEFIGLIQNLHEGFADAQDVLLTGMQKTIEAGNLPKVEHLLEHTLRLNSAWNTVEEAFADPEIKKTMDIIAPPSPSERRARPEVTVWERLGNILLTSPKTVETEETAEKKQSNMSFWSDLNTELRKYDGKHSQDVLRHMRMREDMTQSEVAKAAGEKSVSYISAVERGAIGPSIPSLMEIFSSTKNDPYKSILPFVYLVKAYEENIFGRPL